MFHGSGAWCGDTSALFAIRSSVPLNQRMHSGVTGWTAALGLDMKLGKHSWVHFHYFPVKREASGYIASVKLSSTLARGEEEEANIAVHKGSKQMAAIDCFIRNGTLSHLLNFPVDSRFDKTLT